MAVRFNSFRKWGNGLSLRAAWTVGLGSVFGASLAYSLDSMAYRELNARQREQIVGVKGDCCSAGPKTSCENTEPFACGLNNALCESGSAIDTCGAPSCRESDNSSDACDSNHFNEYAVTITQCEVIPGAAVYCGGDPLMIHCVYVTGMTTATFSGCGNTSFCATEDGPTCQ